MDIETTPETETNFGVEIAQAFVISLATTAGAMMALIAIGTVAGKLQQRKIAKQNAKNED